MNIKERQIIAAILFFIIIVVLSDMLTDFNEGARWWHLAIEGLIGLFAGGGIFFLLKNSFNLQHRLEDERHNVSTFKAEAEKWRMQSKKYLDGLSLAIDSQLTEWGLTSSEKEVAFLLLKGLSLKELADVRGTTEKTARAQAISVYAKSGLAGRSELSAFFLEDLLLPAEGVQH